MPSRIPVRVQNPSFYSRRASAPSKLERLAADYQRRISEEKERKLVELYQHETDLTLTRRRVYGSAGTNVNLERHGMNNGYGGRDRGMIREFFKERRAMEQGHSSNRQYQDNINYHYKQKRSENNRGPSPGKPPLPLGRAAGRDKSKPLAPINRSNHPGSGSSDRSQYSVTPPKPRNQNLPPDRPPSGSDGESPPLDYENLPRDKALIPIGIKRNPIPAIVSADESDSVPSSANSERRGGKFASWKAEQEKVREERKLQNENSPQLPRRIMPRSPQMPRKLAPPSPNMQRRTAAIQRSPQMPRRPVAPPIDNNKKEKPTDFQKFQQEQNDAREDRLLEHRNRQGPPAPDMYDMSRVTPTSGRTGPDLNSARSRPPSGKVQKKQKILQNTRRPVEKETSSDSDSDDPEQAEIREKQARLEALIEAQTRELENMRHKRKQEELKVQEEEDKRRKRATAERERARRLQEAEDASEGSSRLSRRPSYTDGYNSSRAGSANRRANSRPGSRYSQSRSPPESPIMPSPPVKRRASVPKRKPVRQASPPPRVPTPDNDNTAFYTEQISMDPGAVETVNLASCAICGRKFAVDRLERHAKVCQKASKKKRKVFDPVKMRTQGTDQAPYAKQAEHAKKQKPAPKKNWRAQHKNFIQSIRYAKKVTEIEESGGNVADLPPPPVTENPDYKQCPYCERKFSPATAERHIPRCKDIKARPAPPKRRR